MAQKKRKSGARTRGFAPSGDIESMDKMEASDEAKAHEPSDTDAMGQDKRRQVVGHSYGPSRKSQFVTGAIVGAILILGIGGYALAIAAFDQPQDEYADEAVWKDNTIPTRSPSGPCGEPGNPYPQPDDSPCSPGGIKAEATGEKDFTAKGDKSGGQSGPADAE